MVKPNLPEEPIPMPPPAPRPISNSYFWRLMMVNAWGIAGFVFALLGSIFTFLGIILTVAIVTAFVGIPFALLGILFLAGGGMAIYHSYQKAKITIQVLREGEALEGKIVNLGQSSNVRINGRRPWVISYQFRVNGREYQGHVTTLNTPGARLQVGKMAYVLYLPTAPEHNALYPHP
ncbi:MAG: DUF3592 domain-containing protein [Chloroflexota bacterium]